MFEQEAIDLIGPEGAQLLTGIVNGAWGDLHAQPLGFLQRTRRQVMSDHMVQRALQVLPELDYVRLLERETIFWFVWRETVAIRFKHHRRNGLTRNHNSGSQESISNQLTLSGLPPGIIYLSCGAMLDKSESSIAQILLTKPISKTKNEWAIDLERLAGGDTLPQTTPLPIAPSGPPSVGEVLPFRRPSGEVR